MATLRVTGPRPAIAKVSRLRVRPDGRPVGDGGGTTEIGGGGGGDGSGRGGRAIGRNLERAMEVAEMETTARVGERRQLARVYTTALCSRRPHRAVSSRARRTFLFVRTPHSLSVSLRLSRFLLPPPLLSLLLCSSKDYMLSFSPLAFSLSFFYSDRNNFSNVGSLIKRVTLFDFSPCGY